MQGSQCVLFTCLEDEQTDRLESFLAGMGVEVRTFRPGTSAFEVVFGPLEPSGGPADSSAGRGFDGASSNLGEHGEAPFGAAEAEGMKGA